MTVLSLLLLLVSGSWIFPPPDAPATAPLPAPDPITYQFHQDSEMTIFGSSNLRDWTMDVLTIDGEVDVEPAPDGVPSVERIFVEVPVDSLVSGRDGQDEKAHKALQKKAQPRIYFRSESVTLAPGSDADTFEVTAEGELIMATERRTVRLQADGTRQADGSFRFQGEHEMLLSDFDIERPTALLGALRVADEIRVAFDVTLVPTSNTGS